MNWDDLPVWFRRWLRYRQDTPPEPPPGPSPYNGPLLTPVEQAVEVGELEGGTARRAVGPVAETLTALPLRRLARSPIEAVEVGGDIGGDSGASPLAQRARTALTLDPIPTTGPVLADSPTFYARGEPGEPDLIGGRAIRPHGAASHPPGVDVDASDTPEGNAPVGRAYRGGGGSATTEAPGDFHVDTRDGWLSTPEVSFEAWVKPTHQRGSQSLLDARTVHFKWSNRWLWFVTYTLLGRGVVRALADILDDDDDVLRNWHLWRGSAIFGGWRSWWPLELLRSVRHQMGWELHLVGNTLVAGFGTGYSDGSVYAQGVLTTGRWSHVAATCDGTTRRLYVDGALVATTLVNVVGPSGQRYIPPVPGVDLVIARGSSAAIDEVAVYPYVLSGEQIAAHRAGIAAGPTRGLADVLTVLPLRPVARRTLAPVEMPTAALPLTPRGSSPIRPAVTRVRALPLGEPPTDLALREASTDDTRRPLLSVRADWARTGAYDHELSDLTNLVDEVTIDRSIGGDLPAETGLVEGVGSAQMSLRLSGQWDTGDAFAGDTGITGPAHPESLDAVAAFAPYNESAALFGYPTIGTPVVADIGFLTRLGRDLRRRFTGTVSRVNPSSRDRNVAIDALDGANRMRAPITQQATGLDATMLARYGPERYNSRTNSHWLVDRVFRANGYYASPPPQPYSFISATCHGSLIPEVGGGGVPRRANYVTPSNPDQWITGRAGTVGDRHGEHPHRMMYANPEGIKQYTQWTSPEQLDMFPGTGFGCSFLGRMPSDPISPYLFGIILDGGGPSGPSGAYAGTYAVLVCLEGGAPWIYVYTPNSGLVARAAADYVRPSRPTWMPLGFHWSFRPASTTIPGQTTTTNLPVDVVMTLHIDGNQYEAAPFTLNTGSVRANPWSPSTTVECSMGIPMTNVSWFRAPVAPTSREWTVTGHVAQADVDPGLNELWGVPQISGEDSWELLTEVVAAEAGQLGFGGALLDRPYFRSRAVPRDRANPTPLTADRELADMVTVTDEAGVRNTISAAVTPLLVGEYEWVKESKDATEFEAGPGTSYFRVNLPADTVLVEPWSIYSFRDRAYWEAFADHPIYRDSWLVMVVYADKPSVLVNPNLISLGLYPGGPGEIIIAVYNFTGRTVRFATNDTTDSDGVVQPGSAAFKLPGKLLKAAATVPQDITDPGSIEMFGPRTHDLGNSRWHQYPRAMTGVAEAILATTAHPAPLLDTVTVRHDPLRDLDDPVRLVDPYGLGSVRGAVTGITTTLSGQSAVLDELTVRPIAPPGFGVLDDAELGGVGTSLRFGA